MEREIRDVKFPQCDFVLHDGGMPGGDFRKACRSACKRGEFRICLFHNLWRSAVRNMIRAGIAEKIAMQISGHKTRSILDRYNIVNERDLTEAATKMEQRFQSAMGAPLEPTYGTRRDRPRLHSSQLIDFLGKVWLRGKDLNLRPLGYEPNELPDCSTPQFHSSVTIRHGQI